MPEADHLSEVPLPDLLPFLAEADAARLTAAAEPLNSLEPPITRSPWSWLPPDDDAPQRPLLETIITLHTTGTDWLEIWLDIEPASTEDMLAVYAAIEVACFCPTDHNMHAVHELHWLAASGPGLATAFESALTTVHTWIATSPDPTRYRDQAGLPNR